MRPLVGPTDPAAFDNPEGALVLPRVEADRYDAVFDFGCGCGRLARQLIQQRPRPQRYLGIDRHKGMVAWCKENLASRTRGFGFEHHDVFDEALNPTGTPGHLPLPAADGDVTL